jgi:hypothetical protein
MFTKLSRGLKYFPKSTYHPISAPAAVKLICKMSSEKLERKAQSMVSLHFSV